MLKMKYFPGLIPHCKTPGFPVALPLVGVDLCSGLCFSMAQYRHRFGFHSMPFRAHSAHCPELASICWPSSIHSFTT